MPDYFYPKLPARATFPGVLTALYNQRYTGMILLQLRNGEAIKASLVTQAVEIATPAAGRPDARIEPAVPIHAPIHAPAPLPSDAQAAQDPAP